VDDDDRQAERDQDAALELVGLQPGEQDLIDHKAHQHGAEDRGGERGPVEQAHDRQGKAHAEGAEHQDLAVREVDDLHHAEDQGQADGDQRVEQAQRNAVQRELKKVDCIDGHCGRGFANTGPEEDFTKCTPSIPQQSLCVDR
jgi:hypothetical protein